MKNRFVSCMPDIFYQPFTQQAQSPVHASKHIALGRFPRPLNIIEGHEGPHDSVDRI